MKKTCSILLLLVVTIINAHAQIVGDDAFIKGLYTELGICKKGCFGSGGLAPLDYHPRPLSSFEIGDKLGFVCDVDMDGWSVGDPVYFGDYFTPGGAQEGWDIQFNNNVMWPEDPASEIESIMWRHPTYGGFTEGEVIPGTAVPYLITGANTDLYTEGTKKISIWEGDLGSASTNYHWGIRQQVILDTTKRYFVVKVTFTALSVLFGTPTFYYNRTVDGDNDRAFGLGYSSINTIVDQPDLMNNRCLVTSSGTIYPERNYLGLGTLDCRAKSYITTGSIFPSERKEIYESSSGATVAEGSVVNGDIGIGITFKIPAMSFGDSTTISFAYVLSESELEEALALTAPSIEMSGATYTDGDTLKLCNSDSITLEMENLNGLEWDEWYIDGTGTGITSSSITIAAESIPYVLSTVGTSSSCMSDTFRLVIEYVPVRDTVDTTLCSGQIFEFAGNVYTTTTLGLKDTFPTLSGCDSIIVINLLFNDQDTIQVDTAICEGSIIDFYGSEYTTSGTYYYYDTIGFQCDTIHVLNLVVNPTVILEISDTICNGGSVEGYTMTGIYNDTFESVSGCDSIRILNLTVISDYTFTISQTICSGTSYLGYDATGVYFDTFSTIFGCDSIRTLNLSVTPVVYYAFSDTICQGESIEGYSISGVYIDTFESSAGCDRIRTLNLLVNPIYEVTQTITYCRNELPAEYYGIPIPITAVTTPSYATIEFTSSSGCDSIITLDLIINDTNRTDLNNTLCYGITLNWFEHTILSDGSYDHIAINSAGCDSIIRLTVSYTPHPVETDSFISGCEEASYDGIIFTESIHFVDTLMSNIGCDSVYRNVTIEIFDVVYDTIQASICQGENYQFNNEVFSDEGLYTQKYINHNGCDSFITLDLTVHPLPDLALSFEELDEDGLICIGDTVTLWGEGAEHYQFLDAFDEFFSDTNGVLARLFTMENKYYLIGTDHNGCSMRTEVTIVAEHCCDILVPNAFSPNGDGLNDNFGVVTNGNPEDFRMQIFNRWGELLFVSHKVIDRWDGTQKGKLVETGVYHVLISARCSDGTPFVHKGDVHVVR